MARLVRVRGESAYAHVIDLDLNPWAEDQIASGRLTVLERLEKLPPDPWNVKPKPTTSIKRRIKAQTEEEAATPAEVGESETETTEDQTGD